MLSFRKMLAVNSSRLTARTWKPIFSFTAAPITTNAYGINDGKNKIQALVIHTRADGKETETTPDYFIRSNKELASAVYSLLPFAELLGFKLRPCTINPIDWKEGRINPFTIGHLDSAFFKNSEENLVVIDETSLRKKSDPDEEVSFQTEEEIQKELITAASKDSFHRKMGSDEYTIFINPNVTNLTKKLMAEYCAQCLSAHPLWDKLESASGQAVYEAVTGKAAGGRISPHTALISALNVAVTDEIVKEGLKQTLEKLGATKPAHQLGYELLEKRANESTK